jgi:hypothetical protein
MGFAIDMLRMRRPSLPPVLASVVAAGFTTGTAATTKQITIAAAAGERVVVVLATATPTANAPTPTVSGIQAGAYAIQQDLYANSTADVNLWVWESPAQGATPDTSFTFTGLSASTPYAYAVLRYSGVNSTANDVAAAGATGTSTVRASNPNQPPAITPVTTSAKIVAIYATAINATNTTYTTLPANISNFTQANDGGATPVIMVAVGDADWSGSGAFTPDPAYASGGSSSNAWAAATLALRPA